MLPRRLVNFAQLFHQAVEKGLLLLGATLFAFIFVNSNLQQTYYDFLEQPVRLIMGKNQIAMTLKVGLMNY